MTKTTDSRQLGMIFRGVLEKYGAWDSLVADGRDLQVEMDLVMAAKMYFAEFKSLGAAKVREKIFETLRLSAAKTTDFEAMEARVTTALGIRPDGRMWEDIIAFLISEDAKGKTIETFAKVCAEDKFDMPKAHQIAMKPSLITSMWPRAFQVNADYNPQRLDVGL